MFTPTQRKTHLNRTRRLRDVAGRRAAALMEAVEPRRLMSIALVNGVVELRGSESADQFRVSMSSDGQVHHFGQRQPSGSWSNWSFNTSSFQAIHAWLYGGDDVLTTTTTVSRYLVVYAGEGNDTVTTSVGHDVIFGGGGNDSISSGGGNDIVVAGAGNDTVLAASGSDTVLGEAGDDWIWGGSENDSILGGDGNDTLDGSTGNDTIRGGNHDDRIEGYDGNDQLFGDAGNDSIFGQNGHDRIYGGSGNDWLIGGAHNDMIDGGAGHDFIRGDSGNDELFGGQGNDSLYGDAGLDTLWGGDHADLLDGGFDSDTISGGNGNDTARGGSGHDNIYGDAGNDSLQGDAGNDTISGGSGNDQVLGGADADLLLGNDGRDSIYGEGGNDTIDGGNHDDLLRGGSGNDSLSGGSGNDGLYGGAGTDTLVGGSGADRLLQTYTINANGDDALVGAAAEDAVIAFKNKGQINVTAPGQTGTATYAAGAFSDLEIEIMDQALAVLHGATGNDNLLERSDGGSMTFFRVGRFLGSTGSITESAGWNNGAEGVYFAEGTFNAGLDFIRECVLHELGHNWDTEFDETGWNALSGWIQRTTRPAGGYTAAADGWWYRTTAQFVSDYARTNPREDFAESFANYFMNRGGWDFHREGTDIAQIHGKLQFMDNLVSALS